MAAAAARASAYGEHPTVQALDGDSGRTLVADPTVDEADGYICTWPTSAEPTPCSPTTPSASSSAASAAAINRLSVNALLAASTENTTIADEPASRTAIAEETANATD